MDAGVAAGVVEGARLGGAAGAGTADDARVKEEVRVILLAEGITEDGRGPRAELGRPLAIVEANCKDDDEREMLGVEATDGVFGAEGVRNIYELGGGLSLSALKAAVRLIRGATVGGCTLATVSVSLRR